MSEKQEKERWTVELKRPEDRRVFTVEGREAAKELVRNWQVSGYQVSLATMTNRPIRRTTREGSKP